MSYYWPIIIIVGANCVYQLTAKFTPGAVNAFASLIITYEVAAVAATVMFFVTSPNKNLLAAFSNANWTAVVFGLTIVGLEFGYLNLYRVGWNISVGSLVANICLACILVVIGMVLFKESMSCVKMIGIAACIAGLILINKG